MSERKYAELVCPHTENLSPITSYIHGYTQLLQIYYFATLLSGKI